jgi:hypothetical protein
LHAILPHLPAHSIGDIAGRLLTLLSFNNAMLNLHTLQSLQQAFEGGITIQDASKVLKVRTSTHAPVRARSLAHTSRRGGLHRNW